MMRILTSLLILVIPAALALRFDMNPITVDSEVIVVGRPTKLTCNYAKFRTESVREITWFIGYGSIRTQMFKYSVTTNKKESSPLAFITTDEDSATDKDLTFTLTAFRSDNMTFGCEIASLRDDGYGKLRHNKKLAESYVRVINNQQHQLIITPEIRTVTLGSPLVVKCESRGSNPSPKLTLKFGDRNVSEIYGGRVAQNNQEIVARVDEATQDLFQGRDYVTVECLAHFDDYLFGRKEMSLQRSSQSDYYSAPNYGSSTTSDRRRQGWEQDAEYRQRTSSRRHSSSSDEPNFGRSGRGHDHGEGYQADVIHARLMDLVDPARHVHPGIPYDFFSGYILMVTDSAVSSGSTSDHVTLLGELPYDVETSLSRNYGRVNQLGTGRLRVRMDAVKVMNLLGGLGYRVTAASPSGSSYVWTLERKNFTSGGSGSGSDTREI